MEKWKKLTMIQHLSVSNNKGFTLFEIILAVLLLAIAIVPMLNAYSPAIFSIKGEEETAVFTNQARSTLNRTVALGFTTLDSNKGNPVNLAVLFGSTEEADKETFSLKDTSYTPVVSISDVSGGDGGLLEITMTVDRVTLKTLKAEY